MRDFRRCTYAALLIAGVACREECVRAGEAASAEKGGWTVISDRLLADLDKAGKKPAWPGKTTGVAADRTTGDAVVVGKKGFFETTDGGKTWKNAAPLPDPGCRVDWFGNYAWDPRGNVFFFANMGQPAWKYGR